MNQPAKGSITPPAPESRSRSRPIIDPVTAKRNRRLAAVLLLLALSSCTAFLANFGVFDGSSYK